MVEESPTPSPPHITLHSLCVMFVYLKQVKLQDSTTLLVYVWMRILHYFLFPEIFIHQCIRRTIMILISELNDKTVPILREQFHVISCTFGKFQLKK